MNQPEPQSSSFSILMNDVQKGLIKIPQFQRDFVWTKEKSARLLDSILKGYPIGTFILWKTKETLRTVRNLGNATLPDTPEGDFVQYILDGQQRLTSLFASFKGLSIRRAERVDNFGDLFIDLTATSEEELVITDISNMLPQSFVRIVDLLQGNIAFLASFPAEHHAKLSDYKMRLENYSFSTVLVREASIDVATEIFTRINVTGRPLTVFEIMVAKTFDATSDFDLARENDTLIDKLRDAGFETIAPTTVLQTVSAVLTKECSKKKILSLNKKEFIAVWNKVKESIFEAVDYFRSALRIPVSRLMPYNALLVPFAYFFFHHPQKPVGDRQVYLQDFFWRVSFGGRYSYSLESRLAQDIKRIDTILEGKLPEYDYPIDTTAEFVTNNGWFSVSRSYVKAVLCIFAYHQPKSFVDHSLVNINNDWLKRANSKNYHHFFPKAYLKKQGIEDARANHVANITIVDDFLNKRLIKQQAPATYMKSFQKSNPDFKKTMKTHLIRLDTFGVWENDYDRFFSRRCRAIAKQIEKRIVAQKIDGNQQLVHTDDYEEPELEQEYE